MSSVQDAAHAAIAARSHAMCQAVLDKAEALKAEPHPVCCTLGVYKWLRELQAVLDREGRIIARLRACSEGDPVEKESEVVAALEEADSWHLGDAARDPEFRGVKRNKEVASVDAALAAVVATRELLASLVARRHCIAVLEEGIESKDEATIVKAYGVSAGWSRGLCLGCACASVRVVSSSRRTG